MKKKEYIRPEIELVIGDSTEMLCASTTEEVKNKDYDTGMEDLSHDTRFSTWEE